MVADHVAALSVLTHRLLSFIFRNYQRSFVKRGLYVAIDGEKKDRND